MSNANLQLSVTGLTNYIHRCCLVMLLALLTSGCSNSAEQGNSDSQTGEGGGAKVEVPAELSDNEEVKAYFEALQKVNEEYASMLEKVAETNEDAQDGGGLGSAMENMQDMASSAKKMAPLTKRMDTLKKKADVMKEKMNSEERKAFSKAYAKIMERYKEMSREM